MNKDDFIYRLKVHKQKIYLILGVIALICVIVFGAFIINKENIYETFTALNSKKYVLANNVIGVNTNGEINLYSSKNGKVVDKAKINGDYLIDTSDDLKELYMLNKNNGDLYEISTKNNKIKTNVKNINLSSLGSITKFEYENNYLVLLDSNKSFLIKSDNSKTFKKLNPNVDTDINLFKIVDKNLIFTSGEYIFSKSLSVESSSSTQIRISENILKVREKEDVDSEIIMKIPAGEKVEILEQLETGWDLVKYNDKEGYIVNVSTNFKESNTNNGGILKIHIGEVSNSIHKLGEKVLIHNNFGEDRDISILVDINPETLYINNIIKYNNTTNSLISNSKDTRLYINECSLNKNGEIKQVLKYSYVSDMKQLGAYHVSANRVLNNSNAYGSLGYIYYKDDTGINIFNIKSNENDLTIQSNDEFFAPIYSSKQ